MLGMRWNAGCAAAAGDGAHGAGGMRGSGQRRHGPQSVRTLRAGNTQEQHSSSPHLQQHSESLFAITQFVDYLQMLTSDQSSLQQTFL